MNADQRLKKQIERELIEYVMVDVDEVTDEVVPRLYWTGGHNT